jgi:hypothetical protein
MISIYGSKYHTHQFDDILTSVMGYLPEYKINFSAQDEYGGNEYIIMLVLPREARNFEGKILDKILMLETMEFYVNSNYLKVMFEYLDAITPEKITRKTDRLTKIRP